jgi:hypothetical protein
VISVAVLLSSIVTMRVRAVIVAGRTIRCMPVIRMAGAIMMVLKRHALPDSDGSHALHRNGDGQQRDSKDSKDPGHRRAFCTPVALSARGARWFPRRRISCGAGQPPTTFAM